MSAEEKKGGFSPSTFLGGVGGFLGGVGAIAALFVAQPDLITVVIPPERLVQVVERIEPTALPQSRPAVQVALPSPASQISPAPSALPAQSLQGDLEAAIVSIADTPDAFLANVRLINKSQTNAMFAGLMKETGFSGDFHLTDLVGGSCPWKIANSNFSLGSLAVTPMMQQVNPSYLPSFKSVPPGQSAMVTLKFNKNTCDTVPSGSNPITLSGSLVIAEGNALRQATVSFEGVPVAKAE